MGWLPLSHVSPAGTCIVVGPDEAPQASNPKFPRRHGPAEGWFLDLRDVGPWRPATKRPTGPGWIVLHRGEPHPNDPGIEVLVAWVSGPADGLSSQRWRWAPLPPWPKSAHERLDARRMAGLEG